MGLVVAALQILLVLVFARIIISWIPPGGEFLESVRRLLILSTDWLLGPIRRAIPPLRLGGVALDLSPFVVLIGIQLIVRLLVR